MKTEDSPETKTIRVSVCPLLASVMLALLMTTPSFGHRVSVFAYAEGDRIMVDGYFGGKAKAANSVVEIFGSDGAKLLEGKTDVNGAYSFKVTDVLQTKTDLRIVLHTTDGHRAEYTLRMADLPAILTEQSPSVQTQEATESTSGSVKQSAQRLPAADNVVLKRVVEEALDAKLDPIVRTLTQQQKMLTEQKDRGPTIREIFGGIGWIVGIVGVAAYFMSRNRLRGK